ncbi:protein FAM187B-like [Pristis pectinata]|uniref:protein FAM187B-like n=1 Tax=Pristis pectinata TaxID=685728 RepID=UPI00223E7F6C|nr:protein FAM187B-like [Pristis pectinata]
MEPRSSWAPLELATILLLAPLLSCVYPASPGTPVACYPNRPCQIPLLSRNPATLICPNAPSQPGRVTWTYINSSEPGSKAVLLVGRGAVPLSGGSLGDLQSRCGLSPPHLSIRPATVRDSGVYICQVGHNTLAYYEADVQAVDKAHLSGKSIGVSPLPSAFQEVGGQHWELFTLWNAWEGCNRCGVPGERRRLGFCYARPVSGYQPPAPCGLSAARGQQHPARGPEIALESCRVPCPTDSPYGKHPRLLEYPGRKFVPLDNPGTLLIETYLVNVNGNVSLKCPGASVYTPVSWQRNSTYVTRGELSARRGSAHSLDDLTGGSVYRIAGVQKSDQGVYRCYVAQGLAGSFHLRVLDPYGRGGAAAAGSNAMGAVWDLLAAISITSAVLVFLSFLYTYCSQVRRHQVVHW